jgi:hypothetical protein
MSTLFDYKYFLILKKISMYVKKGSETRFFRFAKKRDTISTEQSMRPMW